jgi:hypothetical protein
MYLYLYLSHYAYWYYSPLLRDPPPIKGSKLSTRTALCTKLLVEIQLIQLTMMGSTIKRDLSTGTVLVVKVEVDVQYSSNIVVIVDVLCESRKNLASSFRTIRRRNINKIIMLNE